MKCCVIAMLALNLLIIIRIMNTIKLTVKCPHLIFAEERKEDNDILQCAEMQIY